MPIHVRHAQLADIHVLASMCAELWSSSTEEMVKFLQPILAGLPSGASPIVFVIAEESSRTVGFACVSLRSYADGCDPTRPAGYLHGWFVDKAVRGRGVGRALLAGAEDWARSQGCTEFASDTWIENLDSQRAHQALGFEVVDRVVTFRKTL